jgi:hypothetical protein
MGLSLRPSVIEACEKHWPSQRHNCSGFVRAVASELFVLLPGSTGQADWMTWFIKEWTVGDDTMSAIRPGPSAGLEAANLASRGFLVVAGATSDEINSARQIPPETRTEHGHVVVIIPGFSASAWPIGYWGTLGSTGHKNASLSKCFRTPLKDKLHYFYVKL